MHTPQDSGPRRYETRDARFGPVMGTAFALLGVMVLGLVVAWGVNELFLSSTPNPGAVTETFTRPEGGKLPPEPNLEADPASSLAALRAREDAILNGYGWTDSAKGIARVPVARAMEMLVEREGGK